MFTAKPKPCLSTKEVGDTVSLFGDGSQATYTVISIQPDGYYVLRVPGKSHVVITAASTRINA